MNYRDEIIYALAAAACRGGFSKRQSKQTPEEATNVPTTGIHPVEGQPTDTERVGHIATNHLKEHRRKQYQELQKAGELDLYCKNLADDALCILDSMEYSGASPDMAREAAMRHLLLPSESQVPDLSRNPFNP